MIKATRTISSVAASTAIPVNTIQNPFVGTVLVEAASGSDLTFSVQFTLDDIQDANVTPTWTDFTNLSAIAVAAGVPQFTQESIVSPVTAIRLNVTAYTDGSATLKYVQSAYSS